IEESQAEEAAMADATPYAAQGHRVTYGLIGVNILVFLLMAFTGANLLAPSGEDLIRWGANYLPYTLGGEPWRLFTACFVHIGILHLLLNMYALFQQGIFLESVLGRTRLLTAYIATGLISSLTSLWWHRNDMVVSAGASGAIFGLFGVFGALLTSKLLPDSVRKQLLGSIGAVIVINLLYGLKAGIDNSAHVGGLVSGFIIGQLFLPGLKKKQRGAARISTAIVLAAVIACGSYVALHPDSRLQFETALEQFPAHEAKGLQPFGHDTTVVALIGELDAAQVHWDSARTLLRRTGNLRLSDADVRRRNLLEQYTELRAQQNRLARRQLLGEEGAADSLNALDTAIDKVLQQ
ncbi:MAG: rhomboid family intramembrane serine protease, partial [Chitinophagaceae bacterium]